ncbi:MAG: PEPxxWA-CTERM sorting domain-containing protein [Caulobacteraceae bacterium]|nr:PEPxxWA-CTERM sorting domain-containing protein [Caulobacteraceae bacterium]
MKLGVSLTSLAIAAGLVAATPQATHARILFSGWAYSSIAGPAPGESALVAAGILYDTIPGTAGRPTYDYIYEVWNNGVVPIADFGGGPGVPPAIGGPTYNSDTFFGLPGFPAAGPNRNLAGLLPMTAVPPAQRGKRLPGGWGGANNPYNGSAARTPYTPLYPGSRGLKSPNYQYWGFTKYNTAGGYDVFWYNLVGNQIFGSNRITRFDLNSVFGPVPGVFMDPPGDPMSTTFYDIGWANGDSLENFLTPVIPDPALPGNSCNPTSSSCNPLAVPPEFLAMCPQCTGYGLVPEPGTWAMMLIGLGVVGAMSRSRRTAKTVA